MKLTHYALCAFVATSAMTQLHAQSPTTPNTNPPTINFDKTKDLFIAQFDSKPDPDDIHSIAAIGCMLAHPDLQNIDFYGVQGTVGHQGWFGKNGENNKFIAAPALMNLAFGQGNWTQAGAGLRDTFPNNSNYSDFSPANTNWTASVTRVRDKAQAAINRGGKIYVMEAGNSDFTADWVRALQDSGVSAASTRTNVTVVQHSNWNENQTTTVDRVSAGGNATQGANETVVLNYVKNNTTYRRIADGNGNNATPGYNNSATTWVTRAEANGNANGHARSLWLEAERAMNTVFSRNPNTYPSFSNIRSRGVDFSDAVEAWYIFNRGNSADTIGKFWDRYVTNSNSANGPIPRDFGGGGNNSGGGTGPFRYDFGTASSPVESGYTRVTSTTSAGSFGWTNTSGLDVRDRGTTNGRNALTRDIVFGSQTRTFVQNLDNGSYDVSITLGDQYAHDNITIKAEGTTQASNIARTANQYANVEFTTQVTDGALNLEFSATNGNAGPYWIVNSLTITASSGGGNNGGGNSSSTGNFQEQDGFLVMEAESADLPTGWIIRDQASIPNNDPQKLNGFTGNGFIEWTGAQVFPLQVQPAQANGLITYTFDITNAGTYSLRWRTKQKDAGQTFDAGNDSYLRFASGTNPAGAEDFGTLSKVFIQNKTAWDLAVRAEPRKENGTAVFVTNNFRRVLSAGTHSVQIAARSPGHVIDRLILHRSDVPFNANQFASAPESPRAGGNPNPPAPANETISTSELPSSVASAASYTVQVPYTANQNREVLVALYNTGVTPNTWLGGGRTAVGSGSGTATVTVNMSGGTIQPAGTNYQWRIALPAPGGNWNPDVNASKAVTLTAAGGGNNGGGNNGGGSDPVEFAPQTTSATDTGAFVNATTYRFDFGGPSSPLFAGYSRVTQNTTQGFARWTNNGGLGFRDRGTAQNAINRDFVLGQAARTFTQEIANGSYTVTVNMADADFVHENMQVSAEGMVKLSNQTHGGSAGNTTRTFTVDVADGALDLEFSDQGGPSPYWIVNRIIVTRSEPAGPSVLTYDFGTTGSPLQAGSLRVSPDTLSGTYRWTGGAVMARDRDNGGNTNRDFNFSNQARTFVVSDLANGNWEVEVTIGDASFAQGNAVIATRGATIFNGVGTNANQFKTERAIQNVTDGNIELSFSNNGGVSSFWTVTQVKLTRQ